MAKIRMAIEKVVRVRILFALGKRRQYMRTEMVVS